MRSNVTAFRRPRQLAGWLSDMADIAKEAGKEELKRRVDQQRRSGGGDHIQQQNWTVDQFRQILESVNAGSMEPARASILVEVLAADFERFASQYGPRGFRGGQDVRNLANQIKQSLAQSFPIPPGRAGQTVSENLPLIALAIGGFFLMSRRRR